MSKLTPDLLISNANNVDDIMLRVYEEAKKSYGAGITNPITAADVMFVKTRIGLEDEMQIDEWVEKGMPNTSYSEEFKDFLVHWFNFTFRGVAKIQAKDLPLKLDGLDHTSKAYKITEMFNNTIKQGIELSSLHASEDDLNFARNTIKIRTICYPITFVLIGEGAVLTMEGYEKVVNESIIPNIVFMTSDPRIFTPYFTLKV